MNIALWIVAGLLAAIFLGGGVLKLAQPREKLIASGFPVFEGFSSGAVKAIGTLEVLAAIGLILPAALDIMPVLVPLAAVGAVMLTVGAIIAHGRRREAQGVVGALIVLAMAAFVAWGRFGPESFLG
jgi:DoxX-like protein